MCRWRFCPSRARFTGVFFGGPFRARTPGIDDGRFRSLEGDFKPISISDARVFSLYLDINRKTDYFIASFVVLTLFGAYRHANPIYFGRLRLRNLTHPPPPYDNVEFDWRKGIPRRTKFSNVHLWIIWFFKQNKAYVSYLYGWIVHVLRVSDKEFIQTAGLDGFAFLRVAQLGVQIFFPIAVVVCVVLIPIHVAICSELKEQYEQDKAEGKDTTLSGAIVSVLMQTTAANVTNEANLLWLHVFLFQAMTLYVVWLVSKHAKSFTILRQLYLTTKGDTNLWRAVHQPESILVQLVKQGQNVSDEMDVSKIHENLEEVGVRSLVVPSLQRSKEFKSSDVENAPAIIKEVGHGSLTYFERKESGNDIPSPTRRGSEEMPQFGGVSPIKNITSHSNIHSNSSDNNRSNSDHGSMVMKSTSLMRTTSLGSKAVTAAAAKSTSPMFKSQAFKTKGADSLNRRERLGGASSPRSRDDDNEDGNFAFSNEDPSARSVVSVKARQSKSSAGKGLFRYGGQKNSGDEKKTAKKQAHHMVKVSEESLPAGGDGEGGLEMSPTSSGSASIADTITNTPPLTASGVKKTPSPSSVGVSVESLAATASPNSSVSKRGGGGGGNSEVSFRHSVDASPQQLDYDEVERIVSSQGNTDTLTNDDADDADEVLNYSPSPLKKKSKSPAGPISESVNVRNDDDSDDEERGMNPRQRIDRHAGSSRYAPAERPANTRGAGRRILSIFGDMGNLGRSVVGSSMVQVNRAARNISGRNNRRNNNTDDDDANENALDITDDDVNMLTSSITDTREAAAARNAIINRNTSSGVSTSEEPDFQTELNPPQSQRRMSDREELNDNNNGGMFSPQKLAQKQFRQNTAAMAAGGHHRRTGSGGSFGNLNYNLDISEAQKVVEGRSSLENAIRQAQEMEAASAKNNDGRDVAIDHEWWTGLDISEDPTVEYSYSDMVGALPDVQQSRSVNTYDPESRKLISVWAENYVILLTNIPKFKSKRHKSLRSKLSPKFLDKFGSSLNSASVREIEEKEKEASRAYADEQYATMELMFNEVFGTEFRGMIPVYDHRQTDRLLDQRDEINNKLVQMRGKCVAFGEDPQKMAELGREMSSLKQRSAENTHDKGEKERVRLQDIEAQSNRSVGKSPTFFTVPHRKKKETSTDRSTKLADLEHELEVVDSMILEEREKAWNGVPGPSAFAVFETQTAAAMAAQCLLHRGGANEFVVHPAPGPSDINWQTLLQPKRTSFVRFVFVYPAIVILILTPSTLVATMITSACTLKAPSDNTESFLEWYCDNEEVAGLRLLVSGILPPILLTLWEVFAVSFFLLYLVHAQNVQVSLSATDQRFMKFYYLWGLLNMLIGGILGGAVSGILQQALQNGTTVSSLQQQFGTVLPLSSNFFLSFVFYRAVFIPTYRLIFPHPGVICYTVNTYLRCCFGCTPTKRDRTMKYSPRQMRAGREAGLFSVIILLGLTFSVIAPLIALVCAFFFLTNFIIWRYHLLYVYERGYESNGTVFYSCSELIMWSLLIAQTFVSSVLFSKSAYAPAMVLYLTVPYYLYTSWQKIVAKFGDARSWSVPLGETVKAPATDFGGDIYTHPALRVGARGWHPDVGKVWRGYPGVVSKRTF